MGALTQDHLQTIGLVESLPPPTPGTAPGAASQQKQQSKRTTCQESKQPGTGDDKNKGNNAEKQEQKSGKGGSRKPNSSPSPNGESDGKKPKSDKPATAAAPVAESENKPAAKPAGEQPEVFLAEEKDESTLKTRLLYMEDLKWTEVYEYQSDSSSAPAKILGVQLPAGASTTATGTPTSTLSCSIALSESIFHAQGGGQPTDVGTITMEVEGVAGTTFTFTVSMVRNCKEKTGLVWHDGELAAAGGSSSSGVPSRDLLTSLVGKSCTSCLFQIDGQARLLNARLHTAGHLIDVAVSRVGMKSWRPAKGYHFPDGPYVEYVFPLEEKDEINKDKAGLQQKIEDASNELIKTALVEENPNIKSFVKAGVRHVDTCGIECHCGGTHVDSIAKIGKVSIGKIELKKDRARVKYRIEEATASMC
ncbi:unnamed protein product [Amoebophrya sp. A120]|nr:unnamed protein product [Amoebophrya sp. A120]|eukprot:GSA120T00010717001.1